MRKLALMSAFALLFGVGVASAEPITLPGNEPLVFDFENVEQLNVSGDLNTCIDVPGTTDYGCSDNWGFLRINTISTSVVLDPNTDIADVGVTGLYSTTTNGDTEIFGIFYDIQLTGCDADGDNCTATGGILDLYWHEDGIDGINVVAELDPTTADVDAVDSGIFLVRLVFDNGIISNDETTTVTSDVNLLTDFGSGNANGFMSVDTSVVGLWTDVLNGNWFFIDGGDAGDTRGDGADEFRDVKFRNTFTRVLSGVATDWNGPCVTGANTSDLCVVGLTSSDPAEAFSVTAVPEPATLTLLGLGLGALATRRRRRQQ